MDGMYRSAPLDRFPFSQSSLQDYADCPRRFQLRYLLRVTWPAVQAEPARENERHLQRGERFHRLAQQMLVGVPVDRLNRMAEADPDPNLQRWWGNFLDCIPGDLEGARHVETGLTAPLGRYRLVAKYDLIMARPDGKLVIYDWKTSPKRPQRASLLNRLQTRVYPYLLAQAGKSLNRGCAVDPGAIEMIYWFAEPGDAPEVFTYSVSQWQADEQYLLDLVNEITGMVGREYPMCTGDTACRYCVYRSLCARGVQAGGLISAENYDPESPDAPDIDLEQIGEIRF